jgi:uncharacterized repeat protein (TIGR03803 family)
MGEARDAWYSGSASKKLPRPRTFVRPTGEMLEISMIQILRIGSRALVCALALALFVPVAAAHASTFKVLYSFMNAGDEGNPDSVDLVRDNSGNLYGATALPLGVGAVFKLDPSGNETVLYYFPGGSGGADPYTLVMDKKGNLWGTALEGGIGGGVAFKISSLDKEKLIHTFEGSPNDGCVAEGAMVVGSDNFYGTTFGCGKYDYGTVFTLAPDGSESLLYSFKGGRDGVYPSAGLIIDTQDNLYGTTDYGGKIVACTNGFGGCGTVFKLALNGIKTVLYKFKGPPGDGYVPAGNVIMDASGNLYGTTIYGGRAGCVGNLGCGVVFKLAPDGSETVLHLFTGGRGDGGNPPAGLVADSAGNLFGTTRFGGGSTSCNGAIGCGTVFEITPDGTETILHKFKESTDGANPMGGLVADAEGNLYGTAYQGGQYGYGTVFEITP